MVPESAQDRLAGVLDALDRRPSVGDAPADRAVGGPQLLDLLVGDPVRPLDARAELLHQRPDRPPLLADARVVAIDDDQLRHRLAGNRLALAGSPVADLAERLGDLVGRVVQQRRGDHVAADAEMTLGQLREPLRDPRERVPVALVLPRRRHRLVEGVDERVQVGRREVVLLVPGRRRQDDVGVERVAGHPEVDRGQQVELALRRLLVPVHLLGAQLGRRLLRAHLVLGRAEQVLEEVLVALARGAEQVRSPHRHHLRVVVGGVGVLAGEPQPARAQLGDDVVGDLDPGPLGLVGQVEGAAVEARIGRQPAEPGAERVDVGDVAALEQPATER